MTCGIYKLNFGDDFFYIGKSINIEERFQQHCRKFNNGTAAKNMQEAFNNFGHPSQELLIQCHEDHLDILEPLLIDAFYNSAYCLNGDKPKIHYSIDLKTYFTNENYHLLQKSTVQHIEEIVGLRNKVEWDKVKAAREVRDLRDLKNLEIRELKEQHNKEITRLKSIPEIIGALNIEKEVKRFEKTIEDLKDKLALAETMAAVEQHKYKLEEAKSWWTKLWE